MNWDQIERKWADMTHRVQAQWHPRPDEAARILRIPSDTATQLPADLMNDADMAGSALSTAE